MAVSATGPTDALTSYSSFGPEVEISAPGGEIIHPLAYDMILSTWVNGGYAYLAGTSMATPQVTGLAGLLHALGVTSAAEKRALIRATADDLGSPGLDTQYGAGRINVWAAVQGALGSPPPPPPPPPTNDPPVASFTYSCTDSSCDFVDTSTDDVGVVTWAWYFGDGTSSPQQSPSHEFPAGGTYTVALVVTDGGQLADTAQHDLTVTDPPPPPPNQPPVASFNFSCVGLSCSFTDTSTDDGGVVARFWDFGDGAWSDAANPSHTYADAGTFTVALLVEDADSELDFTTQDVSVIELPPVLSVTAGKVKGELAPELRWTGTVKPVDLYRNGSLIAAAIPSNPAVYMDFTGLRGKASFSYVACIAGTTNCSAPVSVVY
jgi:PKD repeat protein